MHSACSNVFSSGMDFVKKANKIYVWRALGIKALYANSGLSVLRFFVNLLILLYFFVHPCGDMDLWLQPY